MEEFRFTPARAEHFAGLGLGCMWSIASALPNGDLRRSILVSAAEQHAAAGLAGVDSGEYMGDHWLATFAVAMLEAAERTRQEME